MICQLCREPIYKTEEHSCSDKKGRERQFLLNAGNTPEDLKTTGVKFDTGKAQLDLLSTIWLLGVGQVLTFGAKKYDAHNWRKGISRSRLMAAAMRHLLAYNNGEDFDPETGLLHLYHASCCLMFASELHFTKPETDDRYKP